MNSNMIMKWVVKQPQEFFINALVMGLMDSWEDTVTMLMAMYPDRAKRFSFKQTSNIVYRVMDAEGTEFFLGYRATPDLYILLRLLYHLNNPILTLRDDILFELDDVDADIIYERFIKPKFPQLKLDEPVPEELEEAVSEALVEYSK